MEYLRRVFNNNLSHSKYCNGKIFMLNIIFSITVAVLIVMYFVSVNTMVYKGYAIKDAETQIKVLEEQYIQLELDMINLQTIQSIGERAEQLGLVPYGQSEYVKSYGNDVAAR